MRHQIFQRDDLANAAEQCAVEALAIMYDNKISALAVIDGGGSPVGLLHVVDLLCAGVV